MNRGHEKSSYVLLLEDKISKQQKRIAAQDRIVIEATNRTHRIEIENKRLSDELDALHKIRNEEKNHD